MDDCPHIIRVDEEQQTDRYGNTWRVVVIHSAVPVEPHACGYDAASAETVLRAARLRKAANPDLDVRVAYSPALGPRRASGHLVSVRAHRS